MLNRIRLKLAQLTANEIRRVIAWLGWNEAKVITPIASKIEKPDYQLREWRFVIVDLSHPIVIE